MCFTNVFFVCFCCLFVFQGCYELSMPELACEARKATWTAGVEDLLRSDYWPATLHFATIYATDVFFSFEEMKMAWSVLSGIFKNVRSANCPLWPWEYWSYLSFLMYLICALKSCPYNLFLKFHWLLMSFFVIDWEDFSRQLYKKFLWMGGCAIWGGQHLQGGALHLSCVQPRYACCSCGWKLQALPF